VVRLAATSESSVEVGGELFCVAGGSVTEIVLLGPVEASPVVVFFTVTVSGLVGCPFPLYVECKIRPLFQSAAGNALNVYVNVLPCLVTVAVTPAAVTDSKLGTPLIETDKLSSESTAATTIPSGADPPAAIVKDEGAVSDGVSAILS